MRSVQISRGRDKDIGPTVTRQQILQFPKQAVHDPKITYVRDTPDSICRVDETRVGMKYNAL